MWERVELPGLAGPICGFTFPRRGVFLVLTPGGLLRVALDPVEVRPVAAAAALAALYDPLTELLPWDGERHLVYDADGGDVTRCDHPTGDRLVIGGDGTLLITDSAEREVRQQIAGVQIPADGSWMYAGFSEDYRWLFAGEARGVQVFRRKPVVEPAAAPSTPSA